MRAPWPSTGPSGPRETPRPARVAASSSCLEGSGIAQGASQASSRRTAPGGYEMVGPRPGLLPPGRHTAGSVAGPPRVRRHHQGRGPGGPVGTTRAAALVRVHPQRPRRTHRGHQRPDGPQRPVAGSVRLPSGSSGGEVPHAGQDRRRLYAPRGRRPGRGDRRRETRGWWEVTHLPQSFDRNQAITALKVTEFLESGRMAAAFSGGSASAEPGFPVE